MICNPQQGECYVLWIRGLQIPWFDRSNLFFTTDCKSVGTPGGVCGRLVGCVERLGEGGKTPSGWMNDISGEAECYAKAFINLYLSFPPIL